MRAGIFNVTKIEENYSTLNLPAIPKDELTAMSDQKPCPIRGTWLRDFIMAGTSKFDLLKQKKPRRGQPCGSGILNV